MNINSVPREFGDKVFVSLGYCTVKHGAIIGARVTKTSNNEKDDKVEYLVRWFGAGDRADPEEWFKDMFVFDTAQESFGIKK